MEKYAKLREFSREYLKARSHFRSATDNDPILSGNDNLVGRIGEFVACMFLEKELKRHDIKKNPNPVQKGFDVIADKLRVSVKTITAENRRGSTTKITDPWDEFIFVELGQDQRVYRIGYITRGEFMKTIRPERKIVAARKMLNRGGIIFENGKIFEGQAVKDYL